jgi:hypothetical protein
VMGMAEGAGAVSNIGGIGSSIGRRARREMPLTRH